MNSNWIRRALIEVGRAVVCFTVGYGVLVIGMIAGLTFAAPLTGACGNPLIPVMLLGGAGRLLAYRQGMYRSQFLPGLRLALASLCIAVAPILLLALVHGAWENAARFLGAALCLGFVCGGIGALVGSNLWPSNGSASPGLSRVFFR